MLPTCLSHWLAVLAGHSSFLPGGPIIHLCPHAPHVTLGKAGAFYRQVTVARFTISCQSCERLWTVAGAFSVCGRQAMESCPCPHCGAYTLSYQDPNTLPDDKEHELPALAWHR